METHDYSVGLDIGTTKIVAIVGRKNEQNLINTVTGTQKTEEKTIN